MADAAGYFAHRAANKARRFRGKWPATFSPQPRLRRGVRTQPVPVKI